MTHSGSGKNKEVRFMTVLKSAGVFIAAYVFLVGMILYFSPLGKEWSKNIFLRKTAEIVPYPAVLFAGKSISVEKLRFQLESARKFYENQDFSETGMRVDFSTEEGQKRLKIKEKNILEKLIDDAVIENEAKKKGIVITREIVDQEVDRKLKEYGTEDFLLRNLEKLYGWNLEDFKENIVKPDLYKEKMTDYLLKNDPSQSGAREKIESAASELKNKTEWKKVVEKYSEGESRKNGGNMGWFGLDQMLVEIVGEIAGKKAQFQSDPIRSSLGYHIVKINQTKTEEGREVYDISQVFVRTRSFSEWLLEARKERNIFIPLGEFVWNREGGKVEFSSKDLEKYEKELLENPTNDPSLIF